MNLVRRDHWPNSLMDHFFDDFFTGNRLFLDQPSFEKKFTPAVDVCEVDDHFVLSFDLPGVKKEDVQIHFEDGKVTISGERNSTKGSPDSSYTERVYGKFQRTFSLPKGVDPAKVEAEYENGVLQIAVPKATSSATPKQIPIREGKGGLLDRLFSSKKKDEEA